MQVDTGYWTANGDIPSATEHNNSIAKGSRIVNWRLRPIGNGHHILDSLNLALHLARPVVQCILLRGDKGCLKIWHLTKPNTIWIAWYRVARLRCRQLITSDPDWIVSLAPVRDGLLIAYKK
jgi:hypothetical protein